MKQVRQLPRLKDVLSHTEAPALMEPFWKEILKESGILAGEMTLIDGQKLSLMRTELNMNEKVEPGKTYLISTEVKPSIHSLFFTQKIYEENQEGISLVHYLVILGVNKPNGKKGWVCPDIWVKLEEYGQQHA